MLEACGVGTSHTLLVDLLDRLSVRIASFPAGNYTHSHSCNIPIEVKRVQYTPNGEGEPLRNDLIVSRHIAHNTTRSLDGYALSRAVSIQLCIHGVQSPSYKKEHLSE